jgi:hypothetical protein
MNDESGSNDLLTLAAAVALGAAAMYLLDPDKGRRRRAIARDKIRSALCDVEAFAGRAARDLSHRVDGVRAQANRAMRRGETPDDLQLIERVRSKIGRVVSHPHAIHIGALQGAITVSGPVLTHEAHALLDAVRSVPGVASVDNHLVEFDTAGSISSLQGSPERPQARALWMRRNWTPSLRVVAMCAGGLLALAGMRSRTLAGMTIAAAGVALGARGATNVPLASRARPRRNGAQRAQTVSEAQL